VPAQQGCRLHEEASETLAGKESRQPGQDRSIGRLECRSVDLASEDRHLVAQDDDLDRKVRVTATDEPDQLKDAAERPVEKREGGPRMLVAREAARRSRVHSPWMGFSAPTGRVCQKSVLRSHRTGVSRCPRGARPSPGNPAKPTDSRVDLDAQVAFEHVLGPQVGRGPREHDLAAVHEIYRVGQWKCSRDVLLDHQQGCASRRDL